MLFLHLIGKIYYTNKKQNRLSGYTFCHTLTFHADILDYDQGHIFRKYRHEITRRIALIYVKTVKTSGY